MAGIDNITNEILQEAKDKAAAVIAEAKKSAEKELENARLEGGKLAAKAKEKAEKDAAAYGTRINSQIGMRKRGAVLSARQEIIGEVIENAAKQLRSLSDSDYFKMLTALIGKHIGSGSGELLLGKKDLARLPAGFADAVAELGKKAGGALKLSEESAEIDDGFILRYGGIDENCTLSALFAEKHDELSDTAAGAIWHKENTDG